MVHKSGERISFAKAVHSYLDEEKIISFSFSEYGLPEAVPPSHWCVTRADLVSFRKEVEEAVQNGVVFPTASDEFDASDDLFGPSIHTVVEQLIKPKTCAAGGMSWALMLHPEGLQCDLFATHAWQEGVYEFIDQVLYSWPPGAKHLYCCMLSNPQNLNMSALIEEPMESPFAHALKSASCMLVVPNRKVSIYSRIWCAYEAYLAMHWGKTVVTASVPIRDVWLQIGMTLVIYFATWILGAAVYMVLVTWTVGVVSSFDFAIVCMIVLSAGYMLHRLRSGEIIPRSLVISYTCFAGFASGVNVPFVLSGKAADALVRIEGKDYVILEAFLTVIHMIFAVTLEFDRQWQLKAEVQSQQLQQGFAGSIQDANSSVSRDRELILKEISENAGYEAVDASIAVLIRSGMSTSGLREAASSGVAIDAAGAYKISSLLASWAGWIVLTLRGILPGRWHSCWHSAGVITFLESFVWLGLWLFLPLDKKAFAVNSMQKFVLVPYLAGDFLHTMYFLIGAPNLHVIDDKSCLVWNSSSFTLTFFCIPMAMLLSALGPGPVSRVPYIGAFLAKLMLGRATITHQATYRLLDVAGPRGTS